MLHRPSAYALRIRSGKVDEARPVVLVAKMSLFLEEPEHSTNGGVAWRIGKVVQDVGGGCAPAAIDDVHDLPLPRAELLQGSFPSHQCSMGYKPSMSMH